jgi:hypothetical protein
MPFDTDDIAAFVDADMPGYVLATVAGVPVGGLFDNGYTEAFGMVSGRTPSLKCASSAVAAAVRGTAVVVNGANYTVALPQPGTTGFTHLILDKT